MGDGSGNKLGQNAYLPENGGAMPYFPVRSMHTVPIISVRYALRVSQAILFLRQQLLYHIPRGQKNWVKMLEYAELLVNKHLDDYGMLYQIQGLVELQEDEKALKVAERTKIDNYITQIGKTINAPISNLNGSDSYGYAQSAHLVFPPFNEAKYSSHAFFLACSSLYSAVRICESNDEIS